MTFHPSASVRLAFFSSLLERITPSHQGHTVLQYNLIARNSDIFRQMETVKESPPLHFYCNRIAPNEPEPRTFTHPGEVVATVRDRLGLATNPLAGLHLDSLRSLAPEHQHHRGHHRQGVYDTGRSQPHDQRPRFHESYHPTAGQAGHGRTG